VSRAPAPAPRRGLSWLAFDARPWAGALLGAVGGAALYGRLLPEHELPCLVGLGLGVGAASLARDRSVIRGLVLGAVALWASALAQCVLHPEGDDGLLAELAHFHDTLDGPRLLGHALGSLVGGWLAARSLFTRRRRVAGA
jgi:hypothetical protein